MMRDTNGTAPSGAGLARAAAVMRAVGDRCVWTAQISHRALVPYLIEEAAELTEAVEAGTATDLREELGDVLWQVLFHADIASREAAEGFDIDDVGDALADKMIRRHPHVFGSEVATTPDEVVAVWNAAKAAEKRDRTSVLDGLARSMPTLALAQKMLGKRATLTSEGATAVPGVEPTTEEELGEALISLVELARVRGWDADRALRGRVRMLEAEIVDAERGAG